MTQKCIAKTMDTDMLKPNMALSLHIYDRFEWIRVQQNSTACTTVAKAIYHWVGIILKLFHVFI